MKHGRINMPSSSRDRQDINLLASGGSAAHSAAEKAHRAKEQIAARALIVESEGPDSILLDMLGLREAIS
jgi:hypothetical protein